jgi:regulatory protein
MITVTAVETQRGPSRRVKVHLDTRSALSLSVAVAVEAGIHEGQTLSDHEISRLKKTEELHRSLSYAMRILALRPRSEKEIGARLARRGFDTATIQQALAKLKEQGLAGDTAFARFWLDNRERFRPLGRRLIELELKQKGIGAEIIAEAVAEVDDELGAYRAAQKKGRSLSGLEYANFRRRLGAFLTRRGFDYAVVVRIIDRVWQEQGNALPN